MPADPRGTDPDDRSPRERDLMRRSGGGGAMSPWLIIGCIGLIAVAVYIVSALV